MRSTYPTESEIPASTVSRRHARLVVTAEGTVLEDFGSKNGTFRGSERVTVAGPARRRRCHPHRIAARHLPCARAVDVDGHAGAAAP